LATLTRNFKQMTKKTTLVLLPGLDGTDVFFQPLLASLPECVHPLVISYPASVSNTYAELLAFVRQEIADVSECHVLGWSFSGPLALMLAAAEPDKVRGIVLTETFVRAPHPLLLHLRFMLAAPVIWIWRAARRLPLWLFRPRTDPLRRAKTQTWRQVSAAVLAARLRAILGVDAREALCVTRQPVLYLASSRDGIVPRHNVDEIVRLRPSARVITLNGRHQAMYIHPVPAAQAIAAFIAESGCQSSDRSAYTAEESP
jgi:pimeloyl-[acyl-carrier protein] methyl ester esterase